MKRSEKSGTEIFTLSEREYRAWETSNPARDKMRLTARAYSRKYGVNAHIVSPLGKTVYAISPDIA